MKKHSISASSLSFAVSPGETIREELAARDLSQEEFGNALDLSPEQVVNLLNGALPIESRLASRLASFFGTSEALWLNLESQFRDAQREQRPMLSTTAIEEKVSSANGRIALRLPKSLHERITQLAKEEGVSMNHLLIALVAEGVTRHEATHS